MDYFKKRDNLKLKLKIKKNDSGLIKIRNFLLRKVKKSIFKNFLSKDNNNLVKSVYKIETEKPIKAKILFLSDLHFEIINNTDLIKDILKDETFFDFIIFGGDFFDNDRIALSKKDEWDDLINYLNKKSETIISVLGNHDGSNTIDLISKDLNLLINQKLEKKNLSIYGVEDYVFFKETKDFNEIDNKKFNIMISHTPDFIEQIKNQYDLMLSGHTHGGQIKFLNYAPQKNCINKKMCYGKWSVKGIKGITTSGVGCSGFPLRRGIKPEVVIIEIN